MKRREFLINSAMAIGGTPLLTACGNNIIKHEGKIARKKFKDIEVPLLGLGCMRLPMQGSEIDTEEFQRMVDYCMEHGVNYFDNAYFYVDYKSESAMGNALKQYNRKDYILADKSPISKLNNQGDIRRIFDEQLNKCQVDYFDFYMCHGIDKWQFDRYREFNMYDELLKLKKEGKIKYLGFSFHGTLEQLKELINEHKWDFCQLQINYFDWKLINAKDQYDIVQSVNLPVVVMEPIRGSGLLYLPDKAEEKLKSSCPNTTPAEFALRWAASRKNIITVLSGMSNLEQVQQNVATFMNFKPMTKNEEKLADEIAEIYQSQGEINCTGCKYCLEACPNGINIPAIFTLYNEYKRSNFKMGFLMFYETLSEHEKAYNCTKCGLCVKHCTQNLDIPALLAKVDEEYKNFTW